MSERRRVVITGIGPVTPVGIGVERFWEGLSTGRNGVREISAFDHSDLTVHVAGEVPDFVPTDFLDTKEARRTDPFAQYAIASAQLAWQDAGDPEVPSERGAVIYGTGIGGVQTLDRPARRPAGQGTRARLALHGPHADGERLRGPHRHAVRPHGTQLLHGVRLQLVEPRARRGHAADP